jgi:N6-L-threonylcarbamoyladenine synthase
VKVFVLNMRGKPLMPCSPARARKLLRARKATPAGYDPFTIQLTCATGETIQPVRLGADAGYKHVGLSATTERDELFASEVSLRDDLTDLLSTRRELRSSRRNRKTRYRAPRFDNRVRGKRKGWLAPSVENRINAHISRIEKIQKILPVSEIIVETAAFDMQRIRNPDIEGEQYQQGQQLGFWNVREYVLFRDGHKCCHCHGKSKDPVLNVHHIESRRTGGDAPNNLVTLCETCHKAYHDGKIDLKIRRGKSLKAEAFMGIMRWTLFNRLRDANPGIAVKNTYGYITKNTRIRNGIEKAHAADAFCIAGNVKAHRLGECLQQVQTRRHNRQIHKLSILKGGVRKNNQAPREVKGFRLWDKVKYEGRALFVKGRRTSGYFALSNVQGDLVYPCVRSDKLKLLSRKTTFLTELRKEVRRSSPA